MKNAFLTIQFLLMTIVLFGQYEFKVEKLLECTPVKSQDNTGTCWSFATSSFIESELIRMGKPAIDLSEMYAVRNIYKDKARNYILRQGKANFSQGSLSHDVIRAFNMFGAMPESVFSGIQPGDQKHDHAEMEAAMNGFLIGVLKNTNKISNKWKQAVAGILDAYLGEAPEKFLFQGKEYTPESFAKSLSINTDDYISITSFSHHPFYEEFILEIPDNYSNGKFFNIPVDELQRVVEQALQAGYTVAWDGDVSEKGFSAKNGIALMPTDLARTDLFSEPGQEEKVTQAMRQDNFENLTTTDDHLMHLVGIAKDKKGNSYFIVKNSWGEISDYKGYLHMSIPYFRMKTMSIMVHKNGIPADIAKKIKV